MTPAEALEALVHAMGEDDPWTTSPKVQLATATLRDLVRDLETLNTWFEASQGRDLSLDNWSGDGQLTITWEQPEVKTVSSGKSVQDALQYMAGYVREQT